MSTAVAALSGLTVNVSVDRLGVGSYNDDGLFIPPASSSFNIDASIQPMRPDEKLLLPEGSRQTESIKLYTVAELLTMNEETKQPPDVINWEGKQFEVFQVSRFKMGVQDHTKAIAIRKSI